jgi:hypothetical protein
MWAVGGMKEWLVGANSYDGATGGYVMAQGSGIGDRRRGGERTRRATRRERGRGREEERGKKEGRDG